MESRSPTKLDVLNWAFLLLATVLAGIHLYLGLFASFVTGDRATQFIIIAFALLVGPVIYFTHYWRPLLYFLGVGFAVYLGSLWILGGMEYVQFGVLVGVTATSFILLGVYLFIREEGRTTRASERRRGRQRRVTRSSPGSNTRYKLPKRGIGGDPAEMCPLESNTR